jgi:hypothetical protein
MARKKWLQHIAFGWMVLCGLVSTGCQIETAGMTLPSPYYLRDDVQYFAPGPDFKLANEAAALQQPAAPAAPTP